jgi:hypothetical protein
MPEPMSSFNEWMKARYSRRYESQTEFCSIIRLQEVEIQNLLFGRVDLTLCPTLGLLTSIIAIINVFLSLLGLPGTVCDQVVISKHPNLFQMMDRSAVFSLFYFKFFK